MNLRTIGALAASAWLLSGCGAANAVLPAQPSAQAPSAPARALADTTGAPGTLYSRAALLHHVPCVSGSACSGSYDPATGNGTPNGIGAF